MRRLLPLVAVAWIAATATPAAHAAPICSGMSAMTAVESNDALVSAIRETGALEPSDDVFDVFKIAKLTCADLTGDKVQEMTVYLDCCTAASPTPLAIFTPKGDSWKLVYRSTRLLISKQKRDGRKLILTHPVYKRTDPLCCPSSKTKYVVRYADGRFQRRAKT